MGRRVSWCKPMYQRQRRKIRILPASMPALLLLVGLIAIVGLRWLAANDYNCSVNPNQSAGVIRLTVILHKALGEAVPGLEPPPVAKKQAVCNSVMDTFCSITGADLRDPRTILNLELGAGSLVSLPALSPPSPARFSEDGEKSLPLSHSPMTSERETGSRSTVNPGTGPVILIYHTHITESFLPTSQVLFTENMDLSVCRLGKELAGLLREQYGFTVIHHQQIYDQPRRYAYEKARPAIEGLLQDQKQIGLVVDIHRDGVSRASTTAELGGSPFGKILFVIGSGHQGFDTNLKFTLGIQRELESLIPGLSRGIRQQNFVYNQDLHPYSLLVEIGGHENSIDEALKAVPYLAEAIARTYVAFFEMGE